MDSTLILFGSVGNCFGLIGELEQAGMKCEAPLSAASRTLNEFEVVVMVDELNRELENDGRPHDGQIHTPDEFFISSYMGAERPLKVL